MLLCEAGNSFVKFCKDEQSFKIDVADFVSLPEEQLYYINVNSKLDHIFQNSKSAINLKEYISLDTNYIGLGDDRLALCSYIKDGVIVDAGSAITIDVMHEGFHQGGVILPGLKSYKDSYANISEVLDVGLKKNINLNDLPNNTIDAISYGTVSSIVSVISNMKTNGKIYFTGGDGKILSKYFENSIYDSDLLFKSMNKIIDSI